MKSSFFAQGTLLLAIGACSPFYDTTGMSAGGAGGDIPEEVAQIAAPFQDLATARLRPEDGCYWYLHSGPVETALIPLRDVEGRIICSERTSAPIG